MKPKSFFAELKRRNVIRAAILYLGAVWALAQGISQLGPPLGAPEWATRWFLVAAAIGFPLWIAFAWFYEFTPEGLKRETEIDPTESITRHTGRMLDFAIIGVLAAAVVLLLTDRFVLRHGVNETTDAPIPEKSIAVLPFVNMSDDKANDYFSDGISEELLNLLAKIPQLKVTARVSSFSFKGKEVDIPEIARRLHVAHLLEGSVRKAGDQVRITAQLIHAADGFHVWSETYDRKLDDIFKIQDEVAGKVVKELKVTLLKPPPQSRTTDPQAYELFLQGRFLGRQNTAEAFQQSDMLLRQALAIDPRYARAWAALGTNLLNEVSQNLLPTKEGMASAREAAEKALAFEPDYGAAHGLLGNIARSSSDFPQAAEHYQRALELAPTDLSVLGNAGLFLRSLGRLDESVDVHAFYARRDPVNPAALTNLGSAQRCAGRYDDSIASYRAALHVSNRGGAHYGIGAALLLKGDAPAALTEMEQEKSELWRMIGLSVVYHALGRKAESDQALATLIAKYGKGASYSVGYVHVFRGEAEQAFKCLDQAVELKNAGLAEIVAEPFFNKIHSDPRWLPFLRKLGMAPEQLAKIRFKVTLPP